MIKYCWNCYYWGFIHPIGYPRFQLSRIDPAIKYEATHPWSQPINAYEKQLVPYFPAMFTSSFPHDSPCFPTTGPIFSRKKIVHQPLQKRSSGGEATAAIAMTRWRGVSKILTMFKGSVLSFMNNSCWNCKNVKILSNAGTDGLYDLKYLSVQIIFRNAGYMFDCRILKYN